MNTTPELPEHQIFHVLRNGEEDPIGPFSQKQLVELLNQQEIRPNDLVYYPELGKWKPLSHVFDVQQRISGYEDEGQDPHVVAESFNFFNNHCDTGEDIYYIAVQYVAAHSLTAAVRLAHPKSVILTNQRICILGQRLRGGTEFNQYPIEQVENAVKRLKQGDETGIFYIILKSGDWVEVDKIPAEQLKRLEHLAISILRGEHSETA